MSTILGISAFYHDSAAALVVNGEIVAAAQEERFSRKKHDPAFPNGAIAYCLEEAGLHPDQLDYVAFYDKPLTKFDRLLETYFAYAPAGFKSFRLAMPLWLKDKLHMRRTLREECRMGKQTKMVFTDHHESHAASAFFPSPFESAAVLTIDGVGEWSTATCGVGEGNKLRLLAQLQFPHSLGLLYSAFTYYCGFTVNSGEYKLMGLAPYGKPLYCDLILKHLIDLKPDGSLWMNMKYFNYGQGLTMTNGRFDQLFGGPPRQPESMLEQRHMDVAASIQKVTEEVMMRMAKDVHQRTKMKNLVLAGGVALNCVANGKLLRDGPFENIWIQPAAGDAGGALGAALFVWYHLMNKPRKPNGQDSQKASLLGPKFSSEYIADFLTQVRAPHARFSKESELLDNVAQHMAEGKVVGWFDGRMEFGPRALGARSIIGDPRSATMQATMNVKIKFREGFRPFAPCVLREHAHEWFGMRPNEDSPYMLLVAPVLDKHRLGQSQAEQEKLRQKGDLVEWVNTIRSQVPAITHVDYSARVQTVDERNGRFRRLMEKFYQKTGCPIVVNTSFNLSWEPIVCRPEEAYRTFMQSEMDVLVLGDFLLLKEEQPLGFCAWSGAQQAAQPAADSPWADPRTREPLIVRRDTAINPTTCARYPVEEGIPRLFVPTDDAELDGRDVTEMVKKFYEKTPFPNYDNMDNARALLEKALGGLFARALNEQIPYDARVVEMGCGTGQLTNFLSIAHRSVLGTDMCLNSLMLGNKFAAAHGIKRATFAQMNLFRPALKDEFFDVVISNGVLHHTDNPRKAFARISRLAKRGGYVLVGLYNAYSRQLHYARRALYRWTGLTTNWLDPHFGRISAAGKRAAWFQDQYCHPRESCHTIDEVFEWLEENNLEFVNAIPKTTGGPSITANERLFEPKDRGTHFSRVISQLSSLPSGYREGGFFIVIARRR